MAPLMGRGIFASDGEQWRHSRAMLRPSFTKYQMRGIVMPEDHFQNLLALLPENEEEVVDLQDLFHKFTMDTATELLLGQSVGSLCLTKSGTFDTFSHSFKVASEAVITAVRLGPLARILTSAKVVRARKEVHTFVERFIDETLEAHDQGTDGELKDSNDESNGGRYNFLHELVTVTSDRQVILDEVISALFAGRDTTACLLSNLFFCVARDRKVWRKLRDEVCQLPTDYNQADLASLKYTNMCIKECMCSSGNYHITTLTELSIETTSPSPFEHKVPQGGRGITERGWHCRPGPSPFTSRHDSHLEHVRTAPKPRHLRHGRG